MASGKKRKKRASKKAKGKKQTKKAVDTRESLISCSPPDESTDSSRVINSFISKGNIKAALDQAKHYHKQTKSKDSEAILVEVYTARIFEISNKGYFIEAKTLLDLLVNRYHLSDHRFFEINSLIAARNGMMNDLVTPLNDPDISREKRTAIESLIKNELVDLNALAACETLPPGHPLKTGALAFAEAFAEVTRGPVNDNDISLPDISRKSPFAPWKMLIRALESFYRRDDKMCEKYLKAIDPDSAPARLVPAIREMFSENMNKAPGKGAHALVERIHGNRSKVINAFSALEKALAGKHPKKLTKAILSAIDAVRRSCPELVERLKQRISIRAWMNGFNPSAVIKGIKEPSLKNAYYWQLFARASEEKGMLYWACMLWDEFIKHATYEGLFSFDGIELSVIYRHMGDLLNGFSYSEILEMRSQFAGGVYGYYEGQPKNIKDAARGHQLSKLGEYVLFPGDLYRVASTLDPVSDTFRKWLECIEKEDPHWKKSDEVVLAWHKAIPDDTSPLLYLMNSAEKRNALNKALGYLEKAELIDGLHPDVKKARLRLLTSIAIRHLKQKKAHLAKKDFAELEVLPQLNEGDRMGFFVALKFICAMVEDNDDESTRLYDELVEFLGNSITIQMILQSLFDLCGFKKEALVFSVQKHDLPESGDEMAVAVARACMLGDDMGVAGTIPMVCETDLIDIFDEDSCSLNASAIKSIAEAALRVDNYELAYAASGTGLRQQGRVFWSRFLLLRARSLPYWENDRKDDCVSAAIELARRERDMDLIDEAIELRRSGKRSKGMFSIFDGMSDQSVSSMDDDELEDVLEEEKEEYDYPEYNALNSFPGFFGGNDFLDIDDDYDDDYSASEDHDCRNCDAKDCPDRTEDYEPEDMDFNPLNLPPDIPPGFMEMVEEYAEKYGTIPDPEDFFKNHKTRKKMLDIFIGSHFNGKVPSDFLDELLPGFKRESKKSKPKKRRGRGKN